MKKTIQIVTQMEPAGAQVCALALHERLLADGHQSELVFLYDKTGCYNGFNGVSSILSHKPRGTFDLFRILFRLFKLLRANRHCSVLTHTTYANIIGCLVALMATRRRAIAVQHGLPVAEPKLASTVDRYIGPFIYSKIICVSHTVKESFSDYSAPYRSKLYVIQNSLFPCDAISSSDKYQSAFNANFINVLVVGRFHPQKNHRVLFPGIAANKKVRLIMIGDGELKEQYLEDFKKYGIEEQVLLLGELDRPDVIECMKKADFFAFPSIHETFGLVLLEAMSCGMPVIASDIPAVREVAGQAALLINPLQSSDWQELFFERIEEIKKDTMIADSLNRSSLFKFDRMYDSYRDVLSDYKI